MAKDEKTNDGPPIDLDNPQLYLNRELSLLEFQWRVLEEAQDESNPLLERVKFLAIVASNMDELFMVRVGGLKLQVSAGVVAPSIDGATPAEQLAAIRKAAARLMAKQRECFSDLATKLREQGIYLLNYAELNKQQQESAEEYFKETVFPVLTPLAVDPGHPFPHISNLSLNLAVLVQGEDGKQHFARIKVPDTLPRFVPLKRSSGSVRKDGTVPYNHYFVWLEQLIAANLDELFPGLQMLEAHPFRVTRNADMDIQEVEASDLLETMEKSVYKRRFGDIVRLSINTSMPDHIRGILTHNLEVDPNDLYIFDGPLGLSNLMELLNIDRYDLKDKPFFAQPPAILQHEGPDGDIFRVIRAGDILLHHPYDSFAPVLQFLRAAGRDPNVMAIKQTLYRVGNNSPIVDTLLEAQRNRKQVGVLVELKARFDEESNIGWARKLEREGVHVTYGLLGLKTHCKVALVVRREGDHIRRYLHLGTGNYNTITAHLYEDMGIFTCDEDLATDATDLFNRLSGYSAKRDYRKLLIAPINMRERLMELIQREIEHQRKGEQGYLIFKANALTDRPIIKLLYEASRAGVKIDLLIRGICCLRPGLENVSENIKVISILGRFLEHSRIYYFHNAGNPQIYVGSADLMDRNLDRRIEVLFPIGNPEMIKHIHDDILTVYLRDNLSARRMHPDGTYERLKRGDKDKPVDIQNWLLEQHLARAIPLRPTLSEFVLD
jgi:polyphosphate kinase